MKSNFFEASKKISMNPRILIKYYASNLNFVSATTSNVIPTSNPNFTTTIDLNLAIIATSINSLS